VVALIFYGTEMKKAHLTDDVSLKTGLVFLMGLLPLWLGLWEIHQSRMATRELLWQFRNQAEMFGRSMAELSAAGDGSALHEVQLSIFIDLAERSLFETYLWTLHRFHREFDPPAAG
jgi:hypothetical protein